MNKTLCFAGLALAASAALTLQPTAALADDYQWEGGFTYVNIDTGSDSAFGLDLAYYFDPVRTDGLPLAEAAFYNRAGNVTAFWLTDDDLDDSFLNLTAEFYLNRLYLAAGYSRLSNGGTDDDFTVGIGYVPIDGLRLAVRTSVDDFGDVFQLDAKYLAPRADGTAIGIEAITLFDDSFDNLNLALYGDYYFNEALSVGARLYFNDDDFGSDTDWGIGAKYFFTPTISAEIEYENAGDVLMFRIAARF